MRVEIMNLRFERPSERYDFYVDRRSPVGCPYVLREESERGNVCDNYARYFAEKVAQEDPVMMVWLRLVLKALKKYGYVRLYCWCSPKRCHAETIKEWLEKNYEDQKEKIKNAA